MLGLLLLGLLGCVAGLGNYDSSDSYDYDYGESDSRNDTDDERFEDRWPYEYDNLTGYSRCDYRANGDWTDCVGNRYEQKIDGFGNIRYEKIEDEDD